MAIKIKNKNIENLMLKMTLDEKIGQLFQVMPSFYIKDCCVEATGPFVKLEIDRSKIYEAGSVLNTSGAEETIAVQKEYLAKSRLGIPLLFMSDVVHGYRTLFPIPIAMASSWNEEAAMEAARVSAVEASSAGIHVTFSPMVDLVRDPRWGRVLESAGEDVYLNEVMAKAFVKGYQGDLTKNTQIAACVKHFAAYGASEAGREYNTVDLSERTLREYYLPPFKAALEEGCKMVMTSFNIVNGIPSTGNELLVKQILKTEWGFEGTVISDWGTVEELKVHAVCETGRDAAKMALSAGVDIEMMSANYVKHVKELLTAGELSGEQVDDSVRRVLTLKDDLGLFEDPFRGCSIKREKEVLGCKEHRESARKVARESMVLLKNKDVLPLKKETKVALIGPFANSKDLLGAWSLFGKKEEAVTLADAIRDKTGREPMVRRGCTVEGNTIHYKEVKEAVKDADVIILALGESSDMSGESASRSCIKLPGSQEKLLQYVYKFQKPIITILFNGRPLDLVDLEGRTDALLEAWFPGSEGGNAAADILYGDYYPTGRLPMSFPYTTGQIPVYYNCYNTGRPVRKKEGRNGYGTEFIDIPNQPFYCFGYGLSYTQFEYYDMKLSNTLLYGGEELHASVRIRNIGRLSGTEVVQLYIRDVVGSTVRPLKELKAFQRVVIEPGQEVIVDFTIQEGMLKFHTEKLEFKAEKGSFLAMIGSNSEQVQTIPFQLCDGERGMSDKR